MLVNSGAAARLCGLVVSLSGLALTKASLRAWEDGMISLERSVRPWDAFVARSDAVGLASADTGRNDEGCSIIEATGVDCLRRSCFSDRRKNRPDSLACWAMRV